MPLKNIPQAPSAPMRYAPNPPMLYPPKAPTPPPHKQGANIFDQPRIFTDPLLNLKVRNYYSNRDRNVWSEMVGRVYGATIGATIGQYIGGALGTIAGIILTTVGSFTPIPGDEAAGAILTTKSLAGLASAAKNLAVSVMAKQGIIKGAASIGRVLGAGVGSVAGFATSNYTTFYATNDLLKNTIIKSFTKDAGAGVLNTMYAVGGTMDVLSGAALVKSLIYSGVEGSGNGVENIAKAYGLHSSGRKDFDITMIREELGVDLGRVPNIIVDFVGELLVDPGFMIGHAAKSGMVTAFSKKGTVLQELFTQVQKDAEPIMDLLSKAGITGAKESTGQAIKEAVEKVLDDVAENATDEVVGEVSKSVSAAKQSILSQIAQQRQAFKLRKKLTKAILNQDYETIMLEVAKSGDTNTMTYELVKRIVDTTRQNVLKKTSGIVYETFDAIDKIDDQTTLALFSAFLPPVGIYRAAKKVIKTNKILKWEVNVRKIGVVSDIGKVVDEDTGAVSSKSASKTWQYKLFGNKTKYLYEEFKADTIEKRVNKELQKYFDRKYSLGKKDKSDLIMDLDGKKYTSNEYLRDIDLLHNLKKSEARGFLTKEQIELKEALESKIKKVKEFLTERNKQIQKELDELPKPNTKSANDLSDEIKTKREDLEAEYNINEWRLNVDGLPIMHFRQIIDQFKRIISISKPGIRKSNYVDTIFKREAFDSLVDDLIKLVNNNPELLSQLQGTYMSGILEFIERNMLDTSKKTIEDLFKSAKDSFDIKAKEFDDRYSIYQKRAAEIVDQLNDLDSSYKKFTADKPDGIGPDIKPEEMSITEFKEMLMENLDEVNKSITELNNKMMAAYDETSLNANSFLYNYFLKKEKYFKPKYTPIVFTNGAKEYTDILDAMRAVEDMLNKLDLDETKRKNLVKAIMKDWTEELSDMPMEKEVASVYKMDEVFGKVFNKHFNYHQVTPKLTIASRTKSVNSLKQTVDGLIKRLSGNNKNKSIISSLKKLDKAVAEYPESYEKLLGFVEIAGDQSDLILRELLAKTNGSVNGLLSKVDTLMNSKTNPVAIFYLDKYEDVISKHLSRLILQDNGLSVLNPNIEKTVNKLSELLNDIKNTRNELFNKGYNERQMLYAKTQLRNINNCLTTMNILRNMEDFSKTNLEMEIRSLEIEKQLKIDELADVKNAYEVKKKQYESLLRKRRKAEKDLNNLTGDTKAKADYDTVTANQKRLVDEIYNKRQLLARNNLLKQNLKSTRVRKQRLIEAIKETLVKHYVNRYTGSVDAAPESIQAYKDISDQIEVLKQELVNIYEQQHNKSFSINNAYNKLNTITSAKAQKKQRHFIEKLFNSIKDVPELIKRLKEEIEKLEAQQQHYKTKILSDNPITDMSDSKLLRLRDMYGKLADDINHLDNRLNNFEVDADNKISDLIDSKSKELNSWIGFNEEALSYYDNITKQRQLLQDLDDQIDNLNLSEFEDNITPKIEFLEQQIKDKLASKTAIDSKIYDMNYQLSKVANNNMDLFAAKNIDDYAFDYAVNSLRDVITDIRDDIAVNMENGKFMFAKDMHTKATSVLRNLSKKDKFSGVLCDYVYDILGKLRFDGTPQTIKKALDKISDMTSHVQTFRSSSKVMDDMGIFTDFRIENDKLIIKLKDKAGTDITDAFKGKKYTEKSFKKQVTDYDVVSDSMIQTSDRIEKVLSKTNIPDYSFNIHKLKEFLKRRKVKIEKEFFDFDSVKPIDKINPDNVLDVNKIFGDAIDDQLGGFSNINSQALFNIKGSTRLNKTKPKHYYYMDVEATNAKEGAGQALILQMHITKCDINGNVLETKTMYLSPEAYKKHLHGNEGKFTFSQEAYDVHHIDEARLAQEMANGSEVYDLDGMRDAFEKFGCLDEDAMLIAHNGTGYDFGVIINNFYNKGLGDEIFDSKGRFLKNKQHLLDANCMDTLKLNNSFYNRGGRMVNAELAKQFGIKFKQINAEPSVDNLKADDELVEYIFKEKDDDGVERYVIEQYYKGKPLHDAEADTQLLAAWNITQLQELNQLCPEQVNFYDFLTNPVNSLKELRHKNINLESVKSGARVRFEDGSYEVLSKPFDMDKINTILKQIYGSSNNNLAENLTYDDIVRLSVSLEGEYEIDRHISDLMESKYNIGNGPVRINLNNQFKKRFGDINKMSSEKVKKLINNLNFKGDVHLEEEWSYKVYNLKDGKQINVPMDNLKELSDYSPEQVKEIIKNKIKNNTKYKDMNIGVKRKKNYKIYGIREADEIKQSVSGGSHWSELNKDSDYYRAIRQDIEELKRFCDVVSEDVMTKTRTVTNFLSQNTNMAVSQYNKNYVQSLLINSTLLDEDVNLFKHILNGESHLFDQNSFDYKLAEAFRITETDGIRNARNYFNSLFESAIWQNEMIKEVGTHNMDAFYNTVNILQRNLNKYNTAKEFSDEMFEEVKKYLTSIGEYATNPTDMTESQLLNIISHAAEHVNDATYSLTINSDITNHMYKHIKGEILDKLATQLDINKQLDKFGLGDDLYRTFNVRFRNTLETYRNTLSFIKRENKLMALNPIQVGDFVSTYGVRPFDLAKNNSLFTLKHTGATKLDKIKSKIANSIFEDLYKEFDRNVDPFSVSYTATQRGGITQTLAKLLDMDEMEMLSLSRNIKYLDNKEQYNTIWQYFLESTDHHDYSKFVRVQALMDSVNLDSFKNLKNKEAVDLFKTRIRNMFLDNYMGNKALNNLELMYESARKGEIKDIDLYAKDHAITKQQVANKIENKIYMRNIKKGLHENLDSLVAKDDMNYTKRFDCVKKNIEAILDANGLYKNIRDMYYNNAIKTTDMTDAAKDALAKQLNDSAKGMSEFFTNRRDMVLISLDNNFQVKLMDTSPDNIKKMLQAEEASQDYIAVVSRDEYMSLVSETQPIILPGWLEALHKHWVLPTKLFGLMFSMPYMIKNITSAYLQNVTANGGNIFKATTSLAQTFKDFMNWKKIYELATASNSSIYEVLGTFDDVNANWIELFETKNPAFLELLTKEIDSVGQAAKSKAVAEHLQKYMNTISYDNLDQPLARYLRNSTPDELAKIGELAEALRKVNRTSNLKNELPKLIKKYVSELDETQATELLKHSEVEEIIQDINVTKGFYDVPQELVNYIDNASPEDIVRLLALKDYISTGVDFPQELQILINKVNEISEIAKNTVNVDNLKEVKKLRGLKEYVENVTPDEIRRLREMQEYATTNATFGEITELQRNLNISKQKTKDLDELREKLHKKRQLTPDELEYYTIYNTRANEGFKTLKEEYEFLNKKTGKTSKDLHRMSMLKKYQKSNWHNKALQGMQKWTGMKGWMNLQGDIEAGFRIAMVRDQIDQGADLAQATQKVMDTHFIYNDKSIAMKALEVFMPFASYPIKAVNLFTELAGDYSFVKMMYAWDRASWGSEDPGFSDYLKNRKAQGDVPFFNSRGEGRLLHLGNAFTESLTTLANPMGAVNDKLAPILKLPLDLATGAENPRWSHLVGPFSGINTGIQDMERTGSLHAGSFVNMTQAYTNYQANYHRGMYRNYPQHAYMRPFYKNLYTSGGYSRVSMAMQQTTLDNLQYRVGTILYNTRYRHP